MLRDEMTLTTYKPLISLRSQMSNNDTNFIPTSWNLANDERYIRLTFSLLNETGSPDAATGLIRLGTSTKPFGFYDVTIYQNSSDSNLIPALTVKTIYKTMMYVKAVNNDSVDYVAPLTPAFKTNSKIFITNPLG